jgi:hypothetical protein
MTSNACTDDDEVRVFFFHPSRTRLRARIQEHVGPWSAADAEELNSEDCGRLHFSALDGHLHVSIVD